MHALSNAQDWSPNVSTTSSNIFAHRPAAHTCDLCRRGLRKPCMQHAVNDSHAHVELSLLPACVCVVGVCRCAQGKLPTSCATRLTTTTMRFAACRDRASTYTSMLATCTRGATLLHMDVLGTCGMHAHMHVYGHPGLDKCPKHATCPSPCRTTRLKKTWSCRSGLANDSRATQKARKTVSTSRGWQKKPLNQSTPMPRPIATLATAILLNAPSKASPHWCPAPAVPLPLGAMIVVTQTAVVATADATTAPQAVIIAVTVAVTDTETAAIIRATLHATIAAAVATTAATAVPAAATAGVTSVAANPRARQANT